MSDLRSRVIEAGGSALAALGVGTIDTWDEDDIARVVIDAALSVLAEHADEWWTEAKVLPQFEDGGPTMERRLLVVLKEEK